MWLVLGSQRRLHHPPPPHAKLSHTLVRPPFAANFIYSFTTPPPLFGWLPLFLLPPEPNDVNKKFSGINTTAAIILGIVQLLIIFLTTGMTLYAEYLGIYLYRLLTGKAPPEGHSGVWGAGCSRHVVYVCSSFWPSPRPLSLVIAPLFVRRRNTRRCYPT